MSRWRITHIGPQGQRRRVLVTAQTTASAVAQVELALGEALVVACIRLVTPHKNNANTTKGPWLTC